MNKITSVVIVPLFEEGGYKKILFTKRNRDLRHHPGEISFPGGKVEDGEQYAEAAKRETMEEINCKVIRFVGKLKPVMTLVSDHLILPYIASIDIQKLTLNQAEVESVYSLPIYQLFKTKMKTKRYPFRRLFITSPVWQFQTFFVWGATGRILLEFKHWLKENNRV